MYARYVSGSSDASSEASNSTIFTIAMKNFEPCVASSSGVEVRSQEILFKIFFQVICLYMVMHIYRVSIHATCSIDNSVGTRTVIMMHCA